MDLTKLYREAKVPRFMHDSDNGREALERLVAAVLEEAARVAEAQTARSRWAAHGKCNALPTPPCKIAAAIRAMKPTGA